MKLKKNCTLEWKLPFDSIIRDPPWVQISCNTFCNFFKVFLWPVLWGSKDGVFFCFFQFFHFFCCGRYIWLTEMVLTFLEMGDHILRDSAIKNGGYMSLMQNKIVLKVENAIFFFNFPLVFWNFETFLIRILLIWQSLQLALIWV